MKLSPEVIFAAKSKSEAENKANFTFYDTRFFFRVHPSISHDFIYFAVPFITFIWHFLLRIMLRRTFWKRGAY